MVDGMAKASNWLEHGCVVISVVNVCVYVFASFILSFALGQPA